MNLFLLPQILQERLLVRVVLTNPLQPPFYEPFHALEAESQP
jgi:hypothetical protein